MKNEIAPPSAEAVAAANASQNAAAACTCKICIETLARDFDAFHAERLAALPNIHPKAKVAALMDVVRAETIEECARIAKQYEEDLFAMVLLRRRRGDVDGSCAASSESCAAGIVAGRIRALASSQGEIARKRAER